MRRSKIPTMRIRDRVKPRRYLVWRGKGSLGDTMDRAQALGRGVFIDTKAVSRTKSVVQEGSFW